MAELRKYNVGTTIYFPLIDRGYADFESTPVSFAAGDTKISKDGGGFANTVNTPAHLGNGIYSLALTATEVQAAKIIVTLIDQTPTKEWEDQAISIETYGNASGEHAFDLDSAGVTVTTNNDKTGYALTSAEEDAIVDKVWDEARSGHVGVGSFGEGAASVQGNVTGTVASVVGAVGGNVTGNVVGTIGDLAAAAKASVNVEVDSALADIHLDHLVAVAGQVSDATPAANQFDTNLASAVNDFYNGLVLSMISGALAGQTRRITDYAGGNKTVTLASGFTAAPANGDAFVVLANAESSLTPAAVWDEAEGAEPTGAIGSNASMRQIMQYVKRRHFNRVAQTSSVRTMYRDDSATMLQQQVVSDDGTTQEHSKAS
jgi:hypothetical protein